ncbi:hypothetical protein [Paenibacillus sp. LHD-38]|uniref:hypothetical protein n=1 Tax=Paenibacillus sp. LHD-38 TaxID=3072143 RepID=UPI00280DAB42|nr:hypothetical protein [Paenibacillus sp. LHD-38]MDQ8734942.1 hypothetical protein [Paenibacillus sp. LHD-38]
MDFYHSWIYQHVINTEWFMWSVVYLVLGINVLSPVLVWYAMNGKHIIKKYRELKKQR